MRFRMMSDGAIEVLRRELVALGRDGLEHDLEPALEVEAERRALVEGRAGDGQQAHADERGRDQADENEVVPSLAHRVRCDYRSPASCAATTSFSASC